MKTAKKIGFVVESDVDKAVVEALAPRLLGDSFHAYAVRLGGAIAVRWAYSTVLALLEEKQYPHVVLLLDADSTYKPEIERRGREIQAMLDEHDLDSDAVSVCLAVPEIEAWLLAEYEERPEERQDPKVALLQHIKARRLVAPLAADLARKLDIARARARSPSFDDFARTLERASRRLDQAPAA
jgi:hypothetical protein